MFRQEHCALLFRPLEDRSFRCHGGMGLLQWNHLLDRTRCWNLVRMPKLRGKKPSNSSWIHPGIGISRAALISQKNHFRRYFFFLKYIVTVHHLHWGKLFLLLMDIRASRCFLEHSPWLPPRRWMWPMPYEPW